MIPCESTTLKCGRRGGGGGDGACMSCVVGFGERGCVGMCGWRLAKTQRRREEEREAKKGRRSGQATSPIGAKHPPLQILSGRAEKERNDTKTLLSVCRLQEGTVVQADKERPQQEQEGASQSLSRSSDWTRGNWCRQKWVQRFLQPTNPQEGAKNTGPESEEASGTDNELRAN